MLILLAPYKNISFPFLHFTPYLIIQSFYYVCKLHIIKSCFQRLLLLIYTFSNSLHAYSEFNKFEFRFKILHIFSILSLLKPYRQLPKRRITVFLSCRNKKILPLLISVCLAPFRNIFEVSDCLNRLNPFQFFINSRSRHNNQKALYSFQNLYSISSTSHKNKSLLHAIVP